MSDIISIVHAELFKSFKKKRLYIFSFLWWILLPVLSLLIALIVNVNAGEILNEGASINEVVNQITSITAIARNGLFIASLPFFPMFLIFVVLIASLLIGEERRFNMWKTVLTTQPSRWKVMTGKLLAGMILLGIVVLGAYLCACLFGWLSTFLVPSSLPSMAVLLEYLGYFALQWLFGLAALLFAFLMIWLLRNQVMGIISVFFLPALLQGLYSIYALSANANPATNQFAALVEAMRIKRVLEQLPRYFFDSNLYAPSRNPLRNELNESIGEGQTSDIEVLDLDTIFQMPTLTEASVTIAIYAAIFALLLYSSFSRRDIA